MSEPLMSVAGQLVGIPAEKYSGINGITVDQNNKTIGLDETYYTGYNATSGGVFTALANAGISVSDVKAVKIGDIIIMYGNIDPANAISITSGTWTNIGTVNDELKPNSNVHMPFSIGQGSTQLTGVFRITTSGAFDIRQPSTTASFGRAFTVTYSKGA